MMMFFSFYLKGIENVTPDYYFLEKIEHLLEIKSAQMPIFNSWRISRRKINQNSPEFFYHVRN